MFCSSFLYLQKSGEGRNKRRLEENVEEDSVRLEASLLLTHLSTGKECSFLGAAFLKQSLALICLNIEFLSYIDPWHFV